MEYYSATRKKKILPFVTSWMNLDFEGIILSEISQRKTLISLTCGIKNKKQKASL